MNQNLRFFLIITSITVAIDLYAWQGVKFLAQNWPDKNKTILKLVYWGYTVFNFLFFLSWRMGGLNISRQVISIITAISFIIILAKVFWIVFLLIDDIIRLFRWMASFFQTADNTVDEGPVQGISRLKFLNYIGMGIGGSFVGAALWGIAKGAHNYQIKRRNLSISNLPDAFQGLKVLQISDIHSGSFWSYDAVKRGIDLIKKENADMVFFTGDIVNDHSDELEKWKALFGEITAPLGVYSILGNHDYGDYYAWPDRGEYKFPSAEKTHMSPMQKENLKKIHQAHKDMGWNLLLDEHRIIEKDGSRLAVIGVENWSSKGRFPKYGNLAKAYEGTQSIPVKLLLSHDPSHWREEVVRNYKDIQATFSGHTHGMQFGIDTRYYRWSPVKMMYKEWIDLYTQENQHLYVNRGFGYLGFPGRIGVHPEITVFTLKQG